MPHFLRTRRDEVGDLCINLDRVNCIEVIRDNPAEEIECTVNVHFSDGQTIELVGEDAHGFVERAMQPRA